MAFFVQLLWWRGSLVDTFLLMQRHLHIIEAESE